MSVYGIAEKFPNGKEGFLWTDARVIWSNGACLNVQNALGFPDAAPGTNTQSLVMYCRGESDGTLISHSDQYRGLKYSYTTRGGDPGSTVYAEPSPDYFQYVDLGGPGLVPVGYGYRSVEHIVETCMRVESADGLAARQALLKEIDAAGVMATPANSAYNEQVIEAARTILQRPVVESPKRTGESENTLSYWLRSPALAGPAFAPAAVRRALLRTAPN